MFPNFAKYLLCLPTGLLGRYRHTLTRHPPDLADTLMIVMMVVRNEDNDWAYKDVH